MTSKRIILALTTLLTLTCAGLLVAQTTGDTTTPTMDPTMEHDQAMDTATTDAAVQTMVGIVQSFDGNSLVLRTSEGDHTFLVASSTVRPAAVQANLPVTVSYVTESGGDRAVRVVENTQASAESQTPGGQVTGADTAAPTGSTYSNGTTGSMATHDSMAAETTGSMNDTTGSTTGTTGSTTGTTGSTYDSTTSTTSATGTTADTTTPSATDNSLPATGSDAPLMGLVGLLALAGAAGLHAFGRNA